MPKKLSREERYGEQAGLPQTLQEVVEFFADEQTAFTFAVSLRWPDGVFCPFCNSQEHSFISTRRIWKCKACRKQFSVRIGTIFEDSPISLSKWFVAVWMLSNCKNGVSSYELHRAIEVTQKTAWFMLHRVRAAIKAKSFDKKLAGIVEADECYIGGALKNMHKKKRRVLEAQAHEDRVERAEGHKQLGKKRRVRTGAGPLLGKTIVQAVVERDGEVRAQILKTLGTLERAEFIVDNVEEGSRVMTDTGNAKLGPQFLHEFINHEHEYVRGQVHTNGVEGFWSLLNRTLEGTYVSVEPYHLSRYLDEQSFRYNNRETNDGNRFLRAMSQFPSTRLTYKDLIRSNGDGSAN
jgi:transposase-like protein